MSSVEGAEVKLSVMDGGDPAIPLEIEFQGDTNFNPGISQQQNRTKTGTATWRQRDGATITVTVVKQRPLSPGQARLWSLSETGDHETFIYDDANTGGHRREGVAQVTAGEEAANTQGVIEVQFTIAFVQDPVTVVNS